MKMKPWKRKGVLGSSDKNERMGHHVERGNTTQKETPR
jgi:hypothetical protein